MGENEWFGERKCVVATMHQKEEVMAPILKRELSVEIVLPKDFDTDMFGTFAGDVERVGDQLEAARNKLHKALELTGCDLGIASEGSFGPHPVVPFLPFNQELVLFIDKKNDLEVVGFVANTDTNFGSKEVKSFKEAYEFAVSKYFPEHGVILKTMDGKVIAKGIVLEEKLKEVIEEMGLGSSEEGFFVETDMRAMYNPTRMKNIELATMNLVNKLINCCPSCQTPGFEVVDRKKGLPCEYCHRPTDLIKSDLWGCKKCLHQEEREYPTGVRFADPSRCNYCNP
ncbi:hypothetical protein DS745_20720 [Anaerobacillus alkaliphilus]|uniref:DUF6671 domain-containing protein n=1 Tax=Anaerobacillus alkaliphilus TaxID=1548597 RepID=A0A4V1LFR1_9BACI|nr:DUF6671 family protein [Anaerobacillus alkaliphilus]RXI96169.1 hypothetical protein DS745_20720 [Anaerobacillus alkaliphilus]